MLSVSTNDETVQQVPFVKTTSKDRRSDVMMLDGLLEGYLDFIALH